MDIFLYGLVLVEDCQGMLQYSINNIVLSKNTLGFLKMIYYSYKKKIFILTHKHYKNKFFKKGLPSFSAQLMWVVSTEAI